MKRTAIMAIVGVVLVLSMIPVAGSAWESGWVPCAQEDLEGVWDAEIWGGCPEGIQCWNQCTLTIGPDGAIQMGGMYIHCSGGSSEVLGGQLYLNAGCYIQGTIELETGALAIGPGNVVDPGKLNLNAE